MIVMLILHLINFFHKDIFFKIFELDANYIDSKSEHNIKIELTNTNNNYNNGFMTKSTFVSLFVAYLIPKQVLLNFNQLYKDRVTCQIEMMKKHEDLTDIVNFYKKKK